MPFHNGVHYPYGSDIHSTPTSTGIPSLINSPLSPAPASAMTPSSGAPVILPFKFRLRRENVDWRRINAVDVDQVVSQVDLDLLQEHITMVTFCSLEGEYCLRCRNPIDPALVKLLRLSQLSIEWLLHSQEVLTLNLATVEERLVAADREHQHLLGQLKKQEEEKKTLISELKQRKKIIRSQQSMLSPQITSSEKCRHCEKSFLNSSFLQSHMQRRHPEQYDIQLRSDTENESVINSLKSENEGLKAELSRVKQMDQQRQAFETLRIQQMAHQSEREQLAEQRLRAELITQFERKIEDTKDGIRRETEFLFNRNLEVLNEVNHNQAVRLEKSVSPVHSQPERNMDIYKEMQNQATQMYEQQIKNQDEKWESRLQEIKALHKSEQNKLLDELNQTKMYLQKKEHVIRAQREEIKDISSNPSIKVVEVPVVVNSPAPERKPKRVVLEQPVSALKLDPIQELSEEEKDISSVSEKRPSERKPEPAPVKKPRVNNTLLKKHPDIKKELEQVLIKKLESFGVKHDQSGLMKNELQTILAKVQTKRDSLTRKYPDFLRQRKEVVHMVEQRLGEGMTGSKSRNPAQVLQIRPRSSSLPSKAGQGTTSSALREFQTPQPAPRSRSTPQPKTSTPTSHGLTVKTPPFSSDEESDFRMEEEEPVKHLWVKSPQPRLNQSNLVQAKVVKTNPTPGKKISGGNGTKVESDGEDEAWTDCSELQEIDPRQLQSHRDQNGNMENRNRGKENKIIDLARKMEKQSAAERVVKKPAGGVSILPGRKDEVQELTFTDVESSECFDSSEEEEEEDRRAALKPGALKKSLDSASTSVWGTFSGKAPRSGLTTTGTGSTLKSSLGSLSDISDS